jgi:hypothetical protein
MGRIVALLSVIAVMGAASVAPAFAAGLGPQRYNDEMRRLRAEGLTWKKSS